MFCYMYYETLSDSLVPRATPTALELTRRATSTQLVTYAAAAVGAAPLLEKYSAISCYVGYTAEVSNADRR